MVSNGLKFRFPANLPKYVYMYMILRKSVDEFYNVDRLHALLSRYAAVLLNIFYIFAR